MCAHNSTIILTYDFHQAFRIKVVNYDSKLLEYLIVNFMKAQTNNCNNSFAIQYNSCAINSLVQSQYLCTKYRNLNVGRHCNGKGSKINASTWVSCFHHCRLELELINTPDYCRVISAKTLSHWRQRPDVSRCFVPCERGICVDSGLGFSLGTCPPHAIFFPLCLCQTVFGPLDVRCCV